MMTRREFFRSLGKAALAVTVAPVLARISEAKEPVIIWREFTWLDKDELAALRDGDFSALKEA